MSMETPTKSKFVNLGFFHFDEEAAVAICQFPNCQKRIPLGKPGKSRSTTKLSDHLKDNQDHHAWHAKSQLYSHPMELFARIETLGAQNQQLTDNWRQENANWRQYVEQLNVNWQQKFDTLQRDFENFKRTYIGETSGSTAGQVPPHPQQFSLPNQSTNVGPREAGNFPMFHQPTNWLPITPNAPNHSGRSYGGVAVHPQQFGVAVLPQQSGVAVHPQQFGVAVLPQQSGVAVQFGQQSGVAVLPQQSGAVQFGQQPDQQFAMPTLPVIHNLESMPGSSLQMSSQQSRNLAPISTQVALGQHPGFVLPPASSHGGPLIPHGQQQSPFAIAQQHHHPHHIAQPSQQEQQQMVINPNPNFQLTYEYDCEDDELDAQQQEGAGNEFQ